MKITFIGVGDMGSHMVPHLAKAGYDVTVWDKVPAKMAAVADVTFARQLHWKML